MLMVPPGTPQGHFGGVPEAALHYQRAFLPQIICTESIIDGT